MFKKDRRAKVYEASVPGKSEGWRSTYKTVPQIKLQGAWLEELGFEPGTEMRIECSGGKLIITRADEVIAETV